MVKLNKHLNVEILNWDQARPLVQACNPELVSIIDNISPDNTFRLYRASYTYGDTIYDDGIAYFPLSSGETAPITSDIIPNSMREDIGIGLSPTSLTLTNTVELFFEEEDRVMPYRLSSAGEMFGLWDLFDSFKFRDKIKSRLWKITAGARSIFLLPKISNRIQHNKLKQEFALTNYPPKTLPSQHGCFKEIAKAQLDNPWRCDILIFSKQWQNAKPGSTFSALHHYWLLRAWEQSFACRMNMIYDQVWESFCAEMEKRKLHPKNYMISTISHLLTISKGQYPGFTPITDDHKLAPVQFIQKAYLEVYGIKSKPIVMGPCFLNRYSDNAYYSLTLPTLLESTSKPRNIPSIIEELRELDRLAGMISSPPGSKQKQFHFYHNKTDPYATIAPAQQILQDDQTFAEHAALWPHLEFPLNGPFLSGCIRVAKTVTT